LAFNLLVRRLTPARIQPHGCIVQIAPPDFDRMFGALANHTRRDIVRRAIAAEEGVGELASHYPMSFAAVQKHVAVLERVGLVTKERIGRRKIVRTNLERLRIVRVC
jgi:DNA-binding transcriptional ArsR family regulator